ncbi:hypothetical protein CIG75_05765 [Tumebacillus algifaecis]|uniref:Uncharacterized protein n=1 Tax=Tumebacillus algifaecis TaxID=1214604 RepID=A0A223CYY1_9BACL|nr:hypothetical protein [Tumebacillus algifaecis]ASS74551.1 hypothetical protein CIG75_05765 [Tumebacillus algifaecis]
MYTNQPQGGQQGFSQGYSNQGFGGMQQGVNQAHLNQIHQNSLFSGNSQLENAHVQRIQQATISGEEANPLRGAMGMHAGGYGGQQYAYPSASNQAFSNQSYQSYGNPSYGGMQQSVSPAQLERIQQNSIFGGQSQMSNAYPQDLQRVQQASFFNGRAAQSEAGYGGPSGMQQSYNQSGYSEQGYGLQQGVSPAQLNQIHQNSIYGGQSQSSFPQELQRIQQASLSQGRSQGELQSYGGAYGAQQMYNQGYSNQSAYGGMQGVNQAQLERIHQNSLYQGGESQMSSFPQETHRIHQNSLFNGRSQGGYGGANMMNQGFASQGMMSQPNQGQVNQGAFRQVMQADAGIYEQEGPSSYPSTMYRGNQYDNVNQSVMNQMSNLHGMGGAYGRQF